MRLIVGLGNPGRQYSGTRHNAGFEVLDKFADVHRTRLNRKWCRCLVGEVQIGDEKFILAKPQTYMNLSGEAVKDILQRSGIEAASAFVICDDVNLPLGRIRLRPRGSAGGHHGLESIIHCTRSMEFARLRIGVGEGTNRSDLIDHVLGRFGKSERATMNEAIQRSVECLEMVISEGIEAAMNAYN